MLRCPFHEDRTPSFQIYPKTNTYCCFSSNCKAGTGDVIEFIALKEKISKHEAILKAESMLMGETKKKTKYKPLLNRQYLQKLLASLKSFKRKHCSKRIFRKQKPDRKKRSRIRFNKFPSIPQTFNRIFWKARHYLQKQVRGRLQHICKEQSRFPSIWS